MSIIHVLIESASDEWSNPETHAAYTHLTADAGLISNAYATLHTAELVTGPLDATSAGKHLAGLLQRFLDELADAGLEDEHHAVRNDLGSLWRIDWTEIGAAFLGNGRVAA